jgi:hypothetical protein
LTTDKIRQPVGATTIVDTARDRVPVRVTAPVVVASTPLAQKAPAVPVVGTVAGGVLAG